MVLEDKFFPSNASVVVGRRRSVVAKADVDVAVLAKVGLFVCLLWVHKYHYTVVMYYIKKCMLSHCR